VQRKYLPRIALSTILFCLVFTPRAHSAPGSDLKPTGISGSLGAGFATFKIKEPSKSNLKLDQAVFAGLSGEKGFGVLNMYLTISLGYMQTKGQSNYRYSTLSNQVYAATDVGFDANLFQAGLGLKIKIIDGYWIRPYVEGGGVGGYFTIKYNSNLQSKLISPPGTNFKKEDSLLDFGKYAEAGAEISFSEKFGIRAAARQIFNETKEFETLDNSRINYESTIFYLNALMKF
jgi:hypothetical protein